MATLGSLIISLEANTAKFEAAMTKAEYAAKKASDNIMGAFKTLGVALAGVFSISAMDAAFNEITKMESGLLKMASRLNTTVETLSSFSVMARKTGMDTDTFYTALTRLERGISAASVKAEAGKEIIDEEGNVIKKTTTAYQELGLNAEILSKLPLDQKLLAIAEAFQRNIDPSDRVRIAMEIAGKSGAGLVNIFKDGPIQMQKWIDRAKELGIITTDMAKNAALAQSAAGELSIAWAGFARELVDSVAPAITSITNRLTDLLMASRKSAEIRGNIAAGVHTGDFGPGMEGGLIGSGKLEPKAPIYYGTIPNEKVFQTPIRSGDVLKGGGGKGGGGKGGGGDTGLDRMTSIIDTLQKDLSRLTEGSLAEIREWAKKTQDEIDKVGKKGADTSRALGLVNDVAEAKKKKATEEFTLFVAKESGDQYKQIEADAKEWLIKYKGFADSEQAIALIKNRKINEEDIRQSSEKLNIRKSLLEGIGSELPLLSQQLEIKKKILPIEIELRRLELERQMASLKLSHAQKDELRSLMAIETQAKKYSLQRAEWARQGTAGGMKIGSEELKKSAETWAAEQTAALVKQLPGQLSSLIANSLVGFLQGKTPDLQQLGISMAEAMLQKLLEGILNEIIPQMVSVLADALGGILEGIGGGGGILGEIFGGLFHGGGVITAHGGWPMLRYDERLIKAQTGERILSREQNKAYEAGMTGGATHNTIHVYLPNQSQHEIDRFARNLQKSLHRQEARRIG